MKRFTQANCTFWKDQFLSASRQSCQDIIFQWHGVCYSGENPRSQKFGLTASLEVTLRRPSDSNWRAGTFDVFWFHDFLGEHSILIKFPHFVDHLGFFSVSFFVVARMQRKMPEAACWAWHATAVGGCHLTLQNTEVRAPMFSRSQEVLENLVPLQRKKRSRWYGESQIYLISFQHFNHWYEWWPSSFLGAFLPLKAISATRYLGVQLSELDRGEKLRIVRVKRNADDSYYKPHATWDLAVIDLLISWKIGTDTTETAFGWSWSFQPVSDCWLHVGFHIKVARCVLPCIPLIEI